MNRVDVTLAEGMFWHVTGTIVLKLTWTQRRCSGRDRVQVRNANWNVLTPGIAMMTMKPLPILWQRLVAEGKTCDRCNATYQEMQRAIEKLRQSLHPLGIEPRLEIREIDQQSFKANPSESNRIWIAGRPMEEWLGASVGSSRCRSVCGTSECRTVEVEGTTFETIPETLFLRAALVASSQLLSVESGTQGRRRGPY